MIRPYTFNSLYWTLQNGFHGQRLFFHWMLQNMIHT